MVLFLVCFLALEQIKLSFEINRLHTNQENLQDIDIDMNKNIVRKFIKKI